MCKRSKSAFFSITLLTMRVMLAMSSSAKVVQHLASDVALVLGGYGPRYEDIRDVELVTHDRVCSNAISPIPQKPGRFLGDISGLAQSLGDDSVLFCRHHICHRLNILLNKWKRVNAYNHYRLQSSSVMVNNTMVVLGGRDSRGDELISFEMFDKQRESWTNRPEWNLPEGRYSFCTVALNESALAVLGGFREMKALSSAMVLDVDRGQWESLPDLPQARYGHACLMVEWAGRKGVLVTGGALTGKQADFLDLNTMRWEPFAPLELSIDGHKMALVEGIPTIFGWERMDQFNGSHWIDTRLRLSQSRSTFEVVSVPAHLVNLC